jgi:hypothetical protein
MSGIAIYQQLNATTSEIRLWNEAWIRASDAELYAARRVQ